MAKKTESASPVNFQFLIKCLRFDFLSTFYLFANSRPSIVAVDARTGIGLQEGCNMLSLVVVDTLVKGMDWLINTVLATRTERVMELTYLQNHFDQTAKCVDHLEVVRLAKKRKL